VAATSRLSSQLLQSIQNWLWDPFYTVLVGMSSDLDDIRGAVLNSHALSASSSSSSSSSENGPATVKSIHEGARTMAKAVTDAAAQQQSNQGSSKLGVTNKTDADVTDQPLLPETSSISTYTSVAVAPANTATTSKTNFQFAPGVQASGKIYSYNGQPLPFTTDAEYNAWLQAVNPLAFQGPSGAVATTSLVNFQFAPDQVASGKIYSYNGQPLPFTTDAEYNAWLSQIGALPQGPSGAFASTNPFDYFSKPAPHAATETNPFAGLTFQVGSSTPNPSATNAPATPTTPAASGLASVQPSPNVNLSVTVTGNSFASEDQFVSAIDKAVQDLRNNAGLTN
jgi:hypothetical protein